MNNSTNKIRIMTDHNDDYIEMLTEAQLPELEITQNNREANIILGKPPFVAPIISEFCNLKWMQSSYAGIDAMVSQKSFQDYELTNVKGIFGPQIAEYVLGYSIEHFRHFQTYRQQQLEKKWKPHHYRTMSEKKMIILGTGTIGHYLAKTASAFGIHTIGFNSSGIHPKDSSFTEVHHVEQLSAHLPSADIIASTLPKTPKTSGMFNKAFFESCKQVLFFNVGRGDAVHTESLLEALDKDYVRHAFLDVFVSEPISEQCPYWLHPKVTVTPHIAANSFPEQVFAIFKENYLRWRDGTELLNKIDFDKGY